MAVKSTRMPWYAARSRGLPVPKSQCVDGSILVLEDRGSFAVLRRESPPQGGQYEEMVEVGLARRVLAEQEAFIKARATINAERKEKERQQRALTLKNAEGFRARATAEIWSRLDAVLQPAAD